MTQKTKELLHAIVITITAIICLLMLIPGTIYLIGMNTAAPILTVCWGLISLLGSVLFGWGAYTCWKEFKYWHIDKEK